MKWTRHSPAVVIALAIAAAPAWAWAGDIFVAPDGDDTAAGSIDAPLASLERARDRARQAGEESLIWLRGGSYRLAGPRPARWRCENCRVGK